MKIAIAALSKELDATISTQAGRAPYYHIYDDGKLIEIWKNPFSAGGGAGWSVPKVLAEKKVEKVIAGKFGENMESAMKEAGMVFEQHEGSCQEVTREQVGSAQEADDAKN